MKYLTPADFFETQQHELAVKIPGFSFVFFSSASTCKHCEDFMPFFFQLAQSLQGCVLGIMDVDQEDRKIVSMSSNTKQKLEYVPFLMFYVNGIPTQPYTVNESDLQSNVERMRTFLIVNISAVTNGSLSSSSQTSCYSTGIAYNKKKRVCYLSADKAYSAKI